MRKVIPWISALIVIPLVACSFGTGNPPAGPAITPTKSGDQMQTEISQLLTTMPTSTGQPLGEVTPSPDLPTVAVVQTETPAEVNTARSGYPANPGNHRNGDTAASRSWYGRDRHTCPNRRGRDCRSDGCSHNLHWPNRHNIAWRPTQVVGKSCFNRPDG